mgnify:FL=1
MAGPDIWRARIRFDSPPAAGAWRDYFIDSTSDRWPKPTVRTFDGARVDPKLEATVLGLIVAEWQGEDAAIGPQQGELL